MEIVWGYEIFKENFVIPFAPVPGISSDQFLIELDLYFKCRLILVYSKKGNLEFCLTTLYIRLKHVSSNCIETHK